MQSITTEEYKATLDWLQHKISLGGVKHPCGIQIPLEWLIQLMENSQEKSTPMSAEQQFWHIPNVSCYKIR